LNAPDNPITPHANLVPLFPVVFESEWLPLPKSSVPECTTTDLPTTLNALIKYLNSPYNYILLSSYAKYPFPLSSVLILPISPTWRFSSKGPAWFVPNGLKWGPAVVHPLLKSPNSWICSPWRLFGLSPLTTAAILVFALICSY